MALQALLPIAKPLAAASYLSATGCHYLAGLLAHAEASCALTNPSINAYARFAPNALAPQHIVWGADNRGAMLRVIAPRHAVHTTRIENRVGEPMANPYLYMASQIYAGIDGLARKLKPPLASASPYQTDAAQLPATLDEALRALQDDKVLCNGLGQSFVNTLCQIKQQELARYSAAADAVDWQRREIFSKF